MQEAPRFSDIQLTASFKAVLLQNTIKCLAEKTAAQLFSDHAATI